MDRMLPSWQALALRGIVGIVLGVILVFLPHVTLAVLVLTIAAYALFDGILAVIVGIGSLRGGKRHRWGFVFEGAVGIAFALAVVLYPQATAFVLLYFVALWAMVSGMLELILGWQSRMRPGLGVRLSVAGGISIVLGAVIYAEPMVGAVAFARLMAAYGIAFGAALLSTAIHVRAQEPAPSYLEGVVTVVNNGIPKRVPREYNAASKTVSAASLFR